MPDVLSKLNFEFNDTSLDVIVIRHDDNSENETYFFGKEVAKILGYKYERGAVRRHCTEAVSISEILKGGPKQPPHI